MTISLKSALLRTSAAVAVVAGSLSAAYAEEVTIAFGQTGNDTEIMQQLWKPWEEATGNTVTIVTMPSSTTDQFGQYRLWLAAANGDVDLYMSDVIWAPQLADHFVDLTEAAKDIAPNHFASIIESQTVDGHLVAMPVFTDAPALYYRKDLLDKYNQPVPTTWEQLTEVAKVVQDGERAAGNADIWGFVWQGNSYEGLTCDALEWVKSSGGGQIIEADGTISINNPNAIAAIELAATWPGTISPEGVVSYQEEDARGVWQTGNAVFMRNWPYAYGLGNSDDSAVKGLFDVTTLPTGQGHDTSAATLGGWNVAVSKYSQSMDAAVSLAMFMGSEEFQKGNALMGSKLPTIVSLYDDADIAANQPIIPRWKDVFLQAVPRPSAPTRQDYNEVSTLFFSAVHSVLTGEASASDALADLEMDLEDVLSK